jgi:hypothetical protein
MAFQIKDDLFDYGNEAIGKPTGIDIKEQKMTLPLIHVLNMCSKKEKSWLKLPEFFYQLKLDIKTYSLHRLTTNLIFTKKMLSSNAWNNLFAQLLKKLLFLLQILIYPLLTFLLFLIFPYHPTYKWILILLPYPIITVLDVFINFLVKKGTNALLLLIPYLIAFAIIMIIRKKLEKNY